MKHFIFEDREYKINPTFRNPKKRQDNSLYALRKFLNGNIRSAGVSKGIDTRQNCIAKVHYSLNKDAHIYQIEKYLPREGSGKDGGKAVIYGTPIDEYKKNMAAKNFRIFLSPQKKEIKLEVLAKTFIKKLEVETGKKLYYLAAEHYNTAHPHAHLLINGVDKNGEDVTFDRDLVKTFMRENARDICTSLIGSRTGEDIKAEKDAVLTASRWTRIDQEFKDTAKNNILIVKNIYGNSNQSSYVQRIEHLTSLGLCKWENGAYKLDGKWEETLRAQGRYNCYLSAMKNLKHRNSKQMVLYESAMGKISGEVTKIYKTDEVSDNYAVIVENKETGKAYFVPLYKRPECASGEEVIITPKKNQKGRLTPIITVKGEEEAETYNEFKMKEPIYGKVIKIDGKTHKVFLFDKSDLKIGDNVEAFTQGKTWHGTNKNTGITYYTVRCEKTGNKKLQQESGKDNEYTK